MFSYNGIVTKPLHLIIELPIKEDLVLATPLKEVADYLALFFDIKLSMVGYDEPVEAPKHPLPLGDPKVNEFYVGWMPRGGLGSFQRLLERKSYIEFQSAPPSTLGRRIIIRKHGGNVFMVLGEKYFFTPPGEEESQETTKYWTMVLPVQQLIDELRTIFAEMRHGPMDRRSFQHAIGLLFHKKHKDDIVDLGTDLAAVREALNWDLQYV